MIPKPARAPKAPRAIARRARVPKLRKSTFAQQKRRLDTLCAAAVRDRDGHRCTLCGSTGMAGQALDWAHVLSRRYAGTRWAWENSTTLCRRCHYTYTNRPDEWAHLCQTKMGLVRWEALYIKAVARHGKAYLEPWFYAMAQGPDGVKPW